jgi:hypothetical protein
MRRTRGVSKSSPSGNGLRAIQGELPHFPLLQHILVVLFAALAIVAPATAQHIYTDTNNDSLNTSADSLNSVGSTAVDIWLNTGANRDGSPDVCGAPGFITYEFILQAVGGTISWGSYTGSVIGPFLASSPTEYHVAGSGGGKEAPLGLYKLGTLDVSIGSGTPCLVFATSTTLAPWYFTSFGSACLGQRFDHTLRLGADWSDSDGLPFSPHAPPTVAAPSMVLPRYLDPVVVDVQAAITGCGIISSLSADLSALPAGNDAVFTPAPGNLEGTLTWQPTAADGGDFPVLFTATTGADPPAQTTRTTTVRLVTNPVAVEEAGEARPVLALWQNHPNPFNPLTTISYSVPRETQVRLTVYDLSGRVVARLVDGVESPGRHEVRWSGEGHRGGALASGVYWYRLATPFGTVARRLVLAR